MPKATGCRCYRQFSRADAIRSKMKNRRPRKAWLAASPLSAGSRIRLTRKYSPTARLDADFLPKGHAKTWGAPMTDFMLADTPATAGLVSECAFPSTAEAFEGLIRDEYKSLARTIFAIRRGPIRYRRDQAIVIEGDASEYIFLVISGVVRSLKSFQDGARSIVTFYLPTEFFGFTNLPKHLLTSEAAADANILFF